MEREFNCRQYENRSDDQNRDPWSFLSRFEKSVYIKVWNIITFVRCYKMTLVAGYV